MRPVVSLAAALLVAMSLQASACEYSKTLTRAFDASKYDRVEVDALAGSLDVTGADTDKIEFKGLACADRQRYLDRISLDVSDKGRVLRLTVVIPWRDPDFRARYASMDVTITLPRNLEIALRDSSGDIVVDGAAVSRIDDSSGDIRVSDAHSDLVIRDSSGGIYIKRQTGDLTVGDSSGDISARDVSGNLYIPHDSSGDIDLEGIKGNVKIDQDSSGGIDVTDVGQDVDIGSDGSGGIEISNVTGDVHIGNDGSGYVSIEDVRGSLTVDAKGSGDIRTRHIEGKTSLPR